MAAAAARTAAGCEDVHLYRQMWEDKEILPLYELLRDLVEECLEERPSHPVNFMIADRLHYLHGCPRCRAALVFSFKASLARHKNRVGRPKNKSGGGAPGDEC